MKKEHATTTAPQAVSLYTAEGLAEDFANTRELEQFVYEETGHALSLKGKSKIVKYAAALAALESRLGDIPEGIITDRNPFVDSTDMIPMEELKPVPERDPALPPVATQVGYFYTAELPHPDATENESGHMCDAVFKSYKDGSISYEILGPVDQRPIGTRVNKYGQTQAGEIRWSDPRTGEQILQYANGTLSPVGRMLKANLENLNGRGLNAWRQYLNKGLATVDRAVLTNPWNPV